MIGFLVWFVLMQADSVSQFRGPQFWPMSQVVCHQGAPPNYASTSSHLDNPVNPTKLWVYDEREPGTWCTLDIKYGVGKLPAGWYELSTITLMPGRNVPNILPGRSTSETFQKK